MADSRVVTYVVDDETVALFEVEPLEGFSPAGVGEIPGRVREAVAPAVEAARVVLERVKELSPQGVQVKFGVKVTGTMTWVVARAATEANFEVTLSWQPGVTPGGCEG
jgi:hypothetical protein